MGAKQTTHFCHFVFTNPYSLTPAGCTNVAKKPALRQFRGPWYTSRHRYHRFYMAKKSKSSVGRRLPVPVEMIERRIYLIREQKVMLDSDLAELYGVTTGNLNKAVTRNLGRFPEDSMFRLSKGEYRALRFQFGSLNRGQHSKYFPRAFTEQGVAMLSSVLRSDRAVQVNIAIMRAFVRLREIIAGHKDLARKMADLEQQQRRQGKQITEIFAYVQKLLEPPKPPNKKPIGFQAPKK